MTFKVETVDVVHIGEAAERLGVTPTYPRLLERKGQVPVPRRDVFGRVYSTEDLALLRALGVGTRNCLKSEWAPLWVLRVGKTGRKAPLLRRFAPPNHAT